MSNLFTLRDLPRYEMLESLGKRYPNVDVMAISAYVVMARAASDILGALDTYFANHRMTRGRFTVLAILNRDPEQPLNPCELADKAGVTRATMTGLLDGLEREGLVARESVPTDRRMLQVRLTERGNSLLNEILPDYFALLHDFLQVFDENEKKQLVTLLTKFISASPYPSYPLNSSSSPASQSTGPDAKS